MDTDNDITFEAQVARVQTLADGGLRVTLDLPEDAVLAAASLMECKRLGVPGEVTFRPRVDIQSRSVTNAVETRSEWKPKGLSREEPCDDGDTPPHGLAIPA